MLHNVRITDKRQITIPAAIFKAADLKEGDVLVVRIQNNRIIMDQAKTLLNRLAGSLKVPDEYKNKTVDEIITEAKQNRFRNKI